MSGNISQVREAKLTETKINEARENYRPASIRAALLYFILNDLNKISPIYQFSLKVRHGACMVSMSRADFIRDVEWYFLKVTAVSPQIGHIIRLYCKAKHVKCDSAL